MKDIIEEMKKFDELPHLNTLRTFTALKTSVYVFEQNFTDLLRLLEIDDPKIALRIWDAKNRRGINALLLETTRLLHNFVASVMSLRDHSNRFRDKLFIKHPFYSEYNEKIKSCFEDKPIIQFVQDLRNYCLHKTLPVIGASFSLDNLKHTTHLEKRALLKWEKWTKYGKEYLEKQSDKIDLKSVISDYHKEIRHFYDWLRDRFNQIFEKENKEIFEGRKEIIEKAKKEGLFNFD